MEHQAATDFRSGGIGKKGGRKMGFAHYRKNLWRMILIAGMSLLISPLPEGGAATPEILEVYDPTGVMEISQIHAPRLDSLAGKTICELSDDTWQAHRVLPEIRKLLREKYPSAKFIPYTEFPMGNTGIDSEKAADLLVKKGCQAVIIGNAG
jgi:hypothetical protein